MGKLHFSISSLVTSFSLFLNNKAFFPLTKAVIISYILRFNGQRHAMPAWIWIISPYVKHAYLETDRNTGILNQTQQRNYNGCIVFACVGGFRGHCIFWHPWKIMLAHNEFWKRHKKSYPPHKMSFLLFLSLCYKYNLKYPLDLLYFFSI